MKKLRIYQIWNGSQKICDTANKKEIAYYKIQGMQIVQTQSFVKIIF